MRPLGVAGIASVAMVLFAAPTAAGAEARQQGELDRTLDRAAARSSELDRVRTIRAANGARIMRYRQRVAGLPVLDSETIVLAAPEGGMKLRTDGSVASLRAPRPARVSRAEAIAAARQINDVHRLRGRVTARLAISRRRGGTTVWEVRIPAASPLGDFDVLVDARSDRVLRSRDTLRYAPDIRARLYDPNPVMMNNGYGGIKDNHDANSKRLTELRAGRRLTDLVNSRGCLKGLYADARTGPARGSVCKRSRDFRKIRRDDDRFEALMAYYFVDRAQRYIRSLAIGAPINERRQRIDADAISEDNSFYSSYTRRVSLGSGGVDDGEDGDVITHEYGHAVQDDQVPGFGYGLAGASIGEGFGDYLAAAVSASLSPQPAAPLRPWNECMFEWDATSYTQQGCLRTTDTTLTKSQAIIAGTDAQGVDPHIVGEAWSGALWHLRGQLGIDAGGRRAMDRIVLLSHFLLPAAPSFQQGAQALIDADALLYGGAHCAQLGAELVAREFLLVPPAC